MAPEVPLCRGQCQSLSCSVGTSAVAAQPSADPPCNSGGFGSSCTHRAWLPWLHAAWPWLSLSKGSVIVLHAELGAIKAIAWQLDPDLSQAAEVGLHLLQCSVFTATLPVSSYQALRGWNLGVLVSSRFQAVLSGCQVGRTGGRQQAGDIHLRCSTLLLPVLLVPCHTHCS